MTIEDLEHELDNPRFPRSFGLWYDDNSLFRNLDRIVEFYHCLDFSSSNFFDSLYTGRVGNTNSSIYSSLEGTIESIKLLFQNGRINDGFTLMRKYSEAIIIDTYTGVILKSLSDSNSTDINFEELKNNIIKDWINSQATILPLDNKKREKELKKILTAFPKIAEILKLNPKEPNSLYKKIKDLCNDNVHYNGFKNFLYNDIDFNNYNRDTTLILLKNADVCMKFLVSMHFSFIYELHPEYFSSSDYCDCLEEGLTPKEDSQYWVAPIFNSFFSEIVYKYNSELGDYLISLNLMQLTNGTKEDK